MDRKTPDTPQKGTRCDGFVVEVGVPEDQAEATARRAVDAALGSGWELEPWGDGEFQIVPGEGTDLPTPGEAFSLARKLAAQEGVASAEPDLLQPGVDPRPDQVYGVIEESGPGAGDAACSIHSTWALEACRVPQAWALEPPAGGRRYGNGVVIAHPDTGYTLHPELHSERILAGQGYDFEDDRQDPRDSMTGEHPGHGTATASVAMSAREAQGEWEPVDGVAPEAQLVPYRVSTSVVHLSFTNVARAINKASADGHHVISMSLGGPFGPGYLHRAVRRAVRRGVIVVAAAGNVWPWVIYPGRFPESVCVAASNCNSGTWDDSASGSAVDIAAPGESVWRARAAAGVDFSTARSSGTSYATAISAGACALWLGYHGRDNLIARYGSRRHLAPVFKHVLTTAGVRTPAGWDADDYGAGILDVEALLRAPLPDVAPEALEAVGAEPPEVLDEIASFFPDLSPEEVRNALTRFLDLDAEGLNAGVQDVAEEICFRAAVDPTFRIALRGLVKPTGEESVVNLGADASQELRDLIRQPLK